MIVNHKTAMEFVESVCTNSTLSILNLTMEDQADLYILPEGTTRKMMFVLFVIMCVGVIGNMAFLFVVFRVNEMRTPTNVYLSFLALSDTIFLLIGTFLYYTYYSEMVRSHLYTASRVGCFGAFFPQYITYFASIAMITLVSKDRYHAVCNPLDYHKRGKSKLAFQWSLVGLVAAVIQAVLLMTRYWNLVRLCVIWPTSSEKYLDLPRIIGFCTPTGEWGVVIGHLVEFVVFATAMVINSILYAKTIRSLSARVTRKKRLPQDVKVRDQVSRMLITNGTTFFLCQTPFIVITLMFLVEHLAGIDASYSYRKLAFPLTVSHVFVFLNSAINPIIYNIASSHYRNAFGKAFRFRRELG